jgi:hypothetical protein
MEQEQRQQTQQSLTKKDKGRLKKLLRRGSTVQQSACFSGISSKVDWHELQNLLTKKQKDEEEQKGAGTDIAQKSISADILWRCTNGDDGVSTDDPERQRIIEAASHRDLLLHLLRGGGVDDHSTAQKSNGKTKKRKRNDSDDESTAAGAATPPAASVRGQNRTNTFGWACLHNTIAVSSVAVFEMDVECSSAAEWLAIRLSTFFRDHRRNVTLVPTAWYQDTQQRPVSMSEALLYCKNSSDSSQLRNGQPDVVPAVSSWYDLLNKLEALALNRQQRHSNGYPMLPNNYDAADAAAEKYVSDQPMLGYVREPKDFTLEEARAIVKSVTTVVHNQGKATPYVVSQTSQSSDGKRKVFAMDCEMVETTVGLELARVTLCQLVDAGEDLKTDDVKTNLMFDAIVRPRNTVVNYLAQYSGMTEALLNDADITVELEQVQAALVSAVNSQDMVVGHSLENDLLAAHFLHTTVIDTAVLFRMRSSKLSLRHLAATLLQKQIQHPDQPHCSQEDAVTALELAVRRAIRGPSFCILEKRRANWLTDLSSKKNHSTVVCIGPSAWLQHHVLGSSSSAAHALQCDSVHDGNVKAIPSWLAGPSRRAKVVWSKFAFASDVASSSPRTILNRDMEQLERMLSNLFQRLASSSATMVVIAIQAGITKTNEMAKARRVRQNPKATIGWSEEEEQIWSAASLECQKGFVLWVGGPKHKLG